MGRINVLDCTLRDGGYVNDWKFGKQTIQLIIEKLEKTGIEMIELGFIKGNEYDADKSLFPSTDDFKSILKEKKDGVQYLGMLDVSNPVHISQIKKNDNKTIDGIRVIFKKEKILEGVSWCKKIGNLGYKVYANLVCTNMYTDKEFIEAIERFNQVDIDGLTIVDTFGCIKKKQFLRLVSIADHNLRKDIILCYHAHNNLQQAFLNATSLVEMNLERTILIDACVYGMGRGAGNLNLELFVDYLNENHGMCYNTIPILEIMDECLARIYKTRFWGYSLPLYLSAIHNCHPNYAIYYETKNTLNEKKFHELLGSISEEDKKQFSEDVAEKYYQLYLEQNVDDKIYIDELKSLMKGKNILLIAPGKSIHAYQDLIKLECEMHDYVIALNFQPQFVQTDFVFFSNSKRMNHYEKNNSSKTIVVSNVCNNLQADYVINYMSYKSEESFITDNAGVISLKLLLSLDVQSISIAGMDGFSVEGFDYADESLESLYGTSNSKKNCLVKKEIDKIRSQIQVNFITPSIYD